MPLAAAVAPSSNAASSRPPLIESVYAEVTRPTLLRLGPNHDPIDVVEAMTQEGARPAGPGTTLVLVPNVGWALRLTARLQRRGHQVATEWSQARAGWPVVIGTRSAAWSPVPKLRAVVVLDAHDESYTEESAPTYNAAFVVAERARNDGAPCLFVSACPTVTLIEASLLLSVDHAQEVAAWPEITVVDRRGADPRTGMISHELVAAVRAAAESDRWRVDGPYVCVLNRTGRAKLLACAHCGEIARCERCGRSVESVDDVLHCANCGMDRPLVCLVCGATRMKLLRPGVARLREELEALVGVAVAEVSGPKAQGEDALPDARVLVGTEAVLHRIRRASGVCFLDFDQHLLAGRFAAAEESLALLVRAGRLVGGRDSGRGSVMVQTRLPDHEALMAARDGDPTLVSRPETDLRRALSLPPFSALALLTGPLASSYAETVGQEVERRRGLGETEEEIEVSALGPERWLLRADTHQRLCDTLAAAPRPSGRGLRVDVDPATV